MQSKTTLLGVFISILYLVILLATLSDYGINADSPFHFLRGQAYLQKLLTRQDEFNQPSTLLSPVLFYPGQRISHYRVNASENAEAKISQIVVPEGLTIQKQFDLYQKLYGRQSFYKNDAWNKVYLKEDIGHPPISDILSALTNKLFYEKWGVLGDIEAYHVYIVIVAALAIFSVYAFTNKIFGFVPALFAVFTLALYPLFFAESHFNIKDIPKLSFYSLSLISFYFWTMTEKKKWFILFTISFFLGFGTKLNLLLLLPVLFIWLLLVKRHQIRQISYWKEKLIYLILFLVVTIGLFILLWPMLWHDPVTKLAGIFGYYKDLGSKDFVFDQDPHFMLPFGIDSRPIFFVLAATPLWTLTLFAIGLVITIISLTSLGKQLLPSYQEKLNGSRRVGILLLLWLIAPILVVLRPESRTFGSIRQFMEFLPALAILSGLGASFIINTLAKILRLKTGFGVVIIGALYVAYLSLIIVRYHPNQNVYANALVGGPKGAEKKDIFLAWQISYDNPYRQAIAWLNNHAQKNAKLAIVDGSMFAISPLWLREDISLGSYFSGLDKKGEYIISIYYPHSPSGFAYAYLERFIDPVYEVKVEGITLVKVWQNSPQFIKKEFQR